MLLRLLGLKFEPVSPELETRIRSASAAEIDAWSERLLAASSLDEVFDE